MLPIVLVIQKRRLKKLALKINVVLQLIIVLSVSISCRPKVEYNNSNFLNEDKPKVDRNKKAIKTSDTNFFDEIKENTEKLISKPLTYFNIEKVDQNPDTLFAITDQEDGFMQYGSRVAYINKNNDTVINFGKYSFYGTDTMVRIAFVKEHTDQNVYGRDLAIDKNENVLFEFYDFDFDADRLHEGLMRVIRNGKVGYANQFGQIVIPCIYYDAKWFENGKARVTLDGRKVLRNNDFYVTESDNWFYIDKDGKRIE